MIDLIKSWDFTSVIAAVSLAISFLSLGVAWRQYYLTLPRVKMKFYAPYIQGFTENKIANYNSKWTMCVPAIISNVGGTPFSITSVALRYKGLSALHDDRPKPFICTVDDKGVLYTHLDDNKISTLSLPCVLQPGDSIKTAFMFSFADEIYEECKARKFKAKPKIRVSTPFKRIVVKTHAFVLTHENVIEYIKTHKRQLDNL